MDRRAGYGRSAIEVFFWMTYSDDVSCEYGKFSYSSCIVVLVGEVCRSFGRVWMLHFKRFALDIATGKLVTTLLP